MTAAEAKAFVLNLTVASLRKLAKNMQMKHMPKGSLPSDLKEVAEAADRLADKLEKPPRARQKPSAEDAEVIGETKR